MRAGQVSGYQGAAAALVGKRLRGLAPWDTPAWEGRGGCTQFRLPPCRIMTLVRADTGEPCSGRLQCATAHVQKRPKAYWEQHAVAGSPLYSEPSGRHLQEGHTTCIMCTAAELRFQRGRLTLRLAAEAAPTPRCKSPQSQRRSMPPCRNRKAGLPRTLLGRQSSERSGVASSSGSRVAGQDEATSVGAWINNRARAQRRKPEPPPGGLPS